MELDQNNPYASPQNAKCVKRVCHKKHFPTVALIVSVVACALWFLDVLLSAQPIFYPFDEIVVVFAVTLLSPAGAVMGIYSCIFYKDWQSWSALFLGVGSFLFTALSIYIFIFHFRDSPGPYGRVYIEIAEMLGIEWW